MVCILNIKGEAMLQEITVRGALGCRAESKSTVWHGGDAAYAVEKGAKDSQ